MPRAVDVRIDRMLAEEAAPGLSPRRGRSARDLFGEYVMVEGVEDTRILRLFERLHDDVLAEVP